MYLLKGEGQAIVKENKEQAGPPFFYVKDYQLLIQKL